MARDWQALGGRRRARLLIGTLVGLLVIADMLAFGILHHIGESTVVAAFNGRALWPVQTIFSRIAVDAYKTPLPLYLEKYDKLFAALRLVLTAGFFTAGLLVYGYSLPALKRIWTERWSGLRRPMLITGGIVLGCAICVRQIGIFAGGLISIYLLYKSGVNALIPVLYYWAIAAVVTFLTWPYLWPDPMGRIASTFQVALRFRPHEVLFQGQHILSSNLPRQYLPVLIGLELTEPALAFACLGLGVLVARLYRMKVDRLLLSLLSLWICVPVAWQVYQRVPTYNNMRHFFFVLPPLFVFAGVGIEAIVDRVRRPWALSLVAVVTIAPSFWGIVRLHPYQYIYFNSLTGGVGGAYGKFDLDYWCTSVKEATQVVNGIAAPDDSLLVFGPVYTAVPYARSDLRVVSSTSDLSKAGAVVVCARYRVEWDTTGFRLVYQVQRSDATLAEVWQREPAEGSTGQGYVPREAARTRQRDTRASSIDVRLRSAG